MTSKNTLFEKKQWEDILIKQLKSHESLESYTWRSPEGIDVLPFYTKPLDKNCIEEIDTPSQWLAVADYFPEPKKWQVEALNLEYASPDTSVENIFTPDKELFIRYTPYKKSIFFTVDPLAEIAKNGAKTTTEIENSIKDSRGFLSAYPSHKVLMIDMALYQNAGANISHQIALGLLALKEYIEAYGESILSQVFFKAAVGSNFFFEIAKLKSLRLLVQDIFKAYHTTFPVYIFATDSLRNKSTIDIENNIIRSTYEATSAILGGANAVYLHPFDSMIAGGNDFSRELAYKQLMILKEESHLSLFSNSVENTYYIDYLVKQISEQAWNQFIAWEKDGGFLYNLENGTISTLIEKDHKKEQELYERGETIQIGVNKYSKENVKKKNSHSVNTYTDKANTVFPQIKPSRLAEAIESSVNE